MTEDDRSQPDAEFLRHCRIETYRGPGPGGQKRNKTSSAVRMTHLPTGLAAIAGELRSQSQNREMALRRLRLRLALEIRHSLDLKTFALPGWFTLSVAERNPLYPQIVGLVLDALATHDWATLPARQMLNIGSSQFTKFLHADPAVWAVVQRERTTRGLRPLSAQ